MENEPLHVIAINCQIPITHWLAHRRQRQTVDPLVLRWFLEDPYRLENLKSQSKSDLQNHSADFHSHCRPRHAGHSALEGAERRPEPKRKEKYVSLLLRQQLQEN